MFRVSNEHTYHEFEVSSRDELLQELETLNARSNPIDPVKTYRIYELTPDGEILDQAALQIPFQGKIDTILEQFGHKATDEPSKKGILDFVQSIVPRRGSAKEPYKTVPLSPRWLNHQLVTLSRPQNLWMLSSQPPIR